MNKVFVICTEEEGFLLVRNHSTRILVNLLILQVFVDKRKTLSLYTGDWIQRRSTLHDHDRPVL